MSSQASFYCERIICSYGEIQRSVPISPRILWSGGLHLHNAYHCIINFLLKPKPEIFDNFLMVNTKKIDYHRYNESYYQCALSLEEQILAHNSSKRVMWYLISDSITVLINAKSIFGEKLLTSFHNIEHTSFGAMNNASRPPIMRQMAASKARPLRGGCLDIWTASSSVIGQVMVNPQRYGHFARSRFLW